MNTSISAALTTMGAMGRPPTKEPNPGVFGANLKRLRLARGFSQGRVAALAGLSRSTIATAEAGRYKAADTSTILAIAKALGTTFTELTEPHPEREVLQPFVEAFIASAWSKAMKTSAREIAWLNALPSLFWGGASPSPESVQEVLAWHRRHASTRQK